MNDQQSLRNLMVEEIKDLYDAERQLVKALPKMAKGANSDELRSLITGHLSETEEQVKRLERAFEMLDEKPRGKHCAGIAGIIKEGSDLLEEDFEGAVMDAGIIAGAQRAEHYEIGAYGSVIAWAKQLGEGELASLLEDTMKEEKNADEKLSALAEGTINSRAAAAAGERKSAKSSAKRGEDNEDAKSRNKPASSSRSVPKARNGARSKASARRR